jgi:hypothetical protein
MGRGNLIAPRRAVAVEHGRNLVRAFIEPQRNDMLAGPDEQPS